jgi:ketosteroid isomerase-like protein
MEERRAEEEIITQERERLNHWAKGELRAYAQGSADDVSYFDDIGAHARLDGLPALLEYLSALEGQVPAHDYEVVNPRVQLYGDVGIVTLQYHPSLHGVALQPWKATSVYRRSDGQWNMVHAHWSMVKEG